MSDNLKPCPLCDHKEGDVYVMFHGDWARPWSICCAYCGLESGSYETKTEAIQKWNHRPTEDALRAI